MQRILIFLLIATALVSCSKENSAENQLMLRLARCADSNDPKCVFELLDRHSQWSVQTIFRTLKQINETVERNFPLNRQKAALGLWGEGVHAQSPAELFADFCRRIDCMSDFANRVGPIVSTKQISKETKLVETTRGAQFELSLFEEQWGLGNYQKTLRSEKIRLLDKVPQIERDAVAFQEQKIASGGGDSKKEE